MSGVMVFRCSELGARLSVASCAQNFRDANTSPSRRPPGGKGSIMRQHGLGPCVECPIGREHAETGKARSGLHMTVLEAPAASSRPARAPKVALPEVQPIAGGVAEGPTLVHVEKLDETDPRTALKQIEAAGQARRRKRSPLTAEAQQLAVDLRAAVAEAAKTRLARKSWPLEVQQMAVQLAQAGATRLELEATGLSYFSIREWVRVVERGGDLTGAAERAPRATTGRPRREMPAAAEPLAEELRALVAEETIRREASSTRLYWSPRVQELALAMLAAGCTQRHVVACGLPARTIEVWKYARPRGDAPRAERAPRREAPAPAKGSPQAILDAVAKLPDDAEKICHEVLKPHKARWDLMPWAALAEVAEVLTDGARTYPDAGWRDRPAPRAEHVAAAMRHLVAYLLGEERAADSGLPHLAHASARLMLLLERERKVAS